MLPGREPDLKQALRPEPGYERALPLSDSLRVVEEGLTRAHVSEGVPIAPVDTIVVMKLLAGRTQDLADVEAIVASGADRELLASAVERAVPDRADTLRKLFANVDRSR